MITHTLHPRHPLGQQHPATKMVVSVPGVERGVREGSQDLHQGAGLPVARQAGLSRRAGRTGTPFAGCAALRLSSMLSPVYCLLDARVVHERPTQCSSENFGWVLAHGAVVGLAAASDENGS